MVKSKKEIASPWRRRSGNLLSRPISRSRQVAAIAAVAAVASVGANMKVVIRVRPPNTKEQGDNQRYKILVQFPLHVLLYFLFYLYLIFASVSFILIAHFLQECYKNC